jgi:hypothetical protein
MSKQRCENCIYRGTGLCPRGEKGTSRESEACELFLEGPDEESPDA